MNKVDISISDKTNFSPGETIGGNASWFLDSEPKRININLFWYTVGKGTQDLDLIETLDFNPSGRRQGNQDFSFNLPDAPHSFSGKLITLQWAIEVVIDPGGLAARADFVMAPEQQEIIIHAGTENRPE